MPIQNIRIITTAVESSFQNRLLVCRVATVREKYLENEIFIQVREKSGNFMDRLGNLERNWKVREKSGNLKINGYGRQSSENLFILFKKGKDVHSHEID